MQLFYNQSLSELSHVVEFDREESRHIVKVLRKKAGDLIYITNGKGLLFQAKLTLESEKKCVAEINKVEEKQKHNYYLHLAVAPTKNNDRYEWFLEKATEIGVDEITPVICRYSERDKINLERLEKVVISSVKQSLQTHKPILNQEVDYMKFMERNLRGGLYIAHCDREFERVELVDRLREKPEREIVILIGPEGDFSKKEIEKAINKGFEPVMLGKNRLRTETAAVVACASVEIMKKIKTIN